jgi:hypothetical protein
MPPSAVKAPRNPELGTTVSVAVVHGIHPWLLELDDRSA